MMVILDFNQNISVLLGDDIHKNTLFFQIENTDFRIEV